MPQALHRISTIEALNITARKWIARICNDSNAVFFYQTTRRTHYKRLHTKTKQEIHCSAY